MHWQVRGGPLCLERIRAQAGLPWKLDGTALLPRLGPEWFPDIGVLPGPASATGLGPPS
jgi:hypothetical protein